MDDRKQEVIAAIDRYSKFWYSKGLDDEAGKPRVKDYPTINDAHLLYNRIAPLPEFREFPEEVAYAFLLRLYHHEIRTPLALVKFKRLWEGQPKGTCPTCRGDKKIHGGFSHGRPFVIDCPDCDGTAECQHKNVVEVKDDLPVRIYCDDCQQYLKDRRNGEERREGVEHSAWLSLEKESPKLIFRESHENNWYIDRRILKDRRKVVSDDAQVAHSERSGP